MADHSRRPSPLALAALLLLACGQGAAAFEEEPQPEQQLCGGQGGQEQCPVALLQTESRLRTRVLETAFSAQRSSNALRPWGRTYFSTDPAASADFFVRYFSAVRLPLPECDLGQRTAVRLHVAEGSEPQTLVFINDPVTSTWNPSQVISGVADMILGTFCQSEQARMTPWIDNHDAYANNTALNISAMIEDHLPMRFHIEPFDGIVVMHLYVPGTAWTVGPGASATMTKEQTQLLEPLWGQPFPEMCRAGSARLPSQRQGWTKSTYMSAQPGIAAQFMVDILGAELLESEFPFPPQDGCTSVQWVILPESELQVHFVLSQEWQADGFSIEETAQKMDGSKALEGGSWFGTMYNSLVLTADSLDEYVRRLRAKSLPFQVVSTGSDEAYALVMVIPQNAITVQIRSRHVSAEVATPMKGRSSLDFGGLVF